MKTLTQIAFRTQRNFRRESRAVSLLELVGILMVLFPLALCAIDLSAVLLAKNVNESICKDIARGLSFFKFEPEALMKSGDLNTSSKAYHYAEKILAAHFSKQNEMLAKVKIEKMCIHDLSPQKELSQNPENKRITVLTAMEVSLPFAVPPLTPQKSVLHSSYSYPLCTLEEKPGYTLSR